LREIDSEIGRTEIRSDTVTSGIDHNFLAELHNESKHKSESLTVLEDRLVYFASRKGSISRRIIIDKKTAKFRWSGMLRRGS
jgi:hypothetical protein